MRFSAHPERMSAFEKYLKEQGFLHGKCKPHSPWQNGIIERSHRTDNEEFFRLIEFKSSEERKYLLKLWEYEYNFNRRHQGISGKTPMQMYAEYYSIHAFSRSIT
jgi:transposase InsO family protein